MQRLKPQCPLYGLLERLLAFLFGMYLLQRNLNQKGIHIRGVLESQIHSFRKLKNYKNYKVIIIIFFSDYILKIFLNNFFIRKAHLDAIGVGVGK